MPNCVPDTLCKMFHLIQALNGWFSSYSHYTDEETEPTEVNSPKINTHKCQDFNPDRPVSGLLNHFAILLQTNTNYKLKSVRKVEKYL